MKLQLHDNQYIPYYKRISYLYIPAIFVVITFFMELLMFAIMGLAFPSGYIFSLCIIFIIATIVALLPQKWLQTTVCSIFLGWQVFTTISNIIALETGNGVFSLETFAALGTAFANADAVALNLWFLVPIILLLAVYIAGVVLVMWFCHLPKNYKRFEKQSLFCGILAFVSVFSYFFSYVRLPDYDDVIIDNLNNRKFVYDTFCRRVGRMQTFGSYSYYLDNLLYLIGCKTDVVGASALEIQDDFTANEFTLNSEEILGEGYNLISILMETFERQAINPITMPNLYNFIQQSCTEVNGYYSVERTCLTDHISQTGMHPESTEYWLSYQDVEMPHSLAQIFNRYNDNEDKKTEYVTTALHDSHGRCYERNDFFEKTIGFQEFINFYDYTSEEERYEKLYAMNSDELMFERNLTKIAPADKNFYSYVISISTHITDANKYDLHEYYPEEFDLIENQKWDELTELYPVLLSNNPIDVLTAKNYLAGTCSFDKGFGKLLDYLKTTKGKDGKYLIETTAIVMFGDHYYYTKPNILKAEYDDPFSVAGNRCPFIVYNPRAKVSDGTMTQAENALKLNPALCGETLNRFTTTMDIYPTICSLFGIQTDQQLTYGRSIFDESPSVGVAYMSGYIFGIARTAEDPGYTVLENTTDLISGEPQIKWHLWRTNDFEEFNGVTLNQAQIDYIAPTVSRVYGSVFLNSKLYESDGFKDLDKAYYTLGKSN